jgi:hypothetical protein
MLSSLVPVLALLVAGTQAVAITVYRRDEWIKASSALPPPEKELFRTIPMGANSITIPKKIHLFGGEEVEKYDSWNVYVYVPEGLMPNGVPLEDM